MTNSDNAKRASSATSAHAAEIDPTSLLDPELRERLSVIVEMTGGAFTLDDTVLPRFRAGAEQWVRPARSDVSVSEHIIPGHQEAPPVRVYIINAKQSEATRPVILHFHGGGFIAGSPKNDVAKLQDIASAYDCLIVSVAYRLSPETRFPGALEDNYAALKWLHASPATLAADPTRVVLLGESAGASHAAQLSLLARDRNETPIKAQILLYPMLDDRTGGSSIGPAHLRAFLWTAALNQYGWRAYLGVEPGGADIPAGAAPAREENLAGLPPTWIGVGALDLFVEENIAFAQRLLAAGVPTELLVAPGAVHGFNEMAPDAAVSRSFDASWHGALKRAFAR